VRRFDTTYAALDADGAWSSFDMATLLCGSADAACAAPGGSHQFFGCVFDGRYVYFIPRGGGVLVRFDAKNPPSLPAFDGGGIVSFL
jgi:hypothetical protein